MSRPAHLWPVRVYYEDTDAGGVVYYANYLKFMERGRTEFLRELGFAQSALRKEYGVLFAVVEAQVRFLRPARLDEKLIVRTEVAELSGARITFAQAVLREDDETPLVEARVVVAAISEEGRARRIPQPVAEALARHLAEGA